MNLVVAAASRRSAVLKERAQLRRSAETPLRQQGRAGQGRTHRATQRQKLKCASNSPANHLGLAFQPEVCYQ